MLISKNSPNLASDGIGAAGEETLVADVDVDVVVALATVLVVGAGVVVFVVAAEATFLGVEIDDGVLLVVDFSTNVN